MAQTFLQSHTNSRKAGQKLAKFEHPSDALARSVEVADDHYVVSYVPHGIARELGVKSSEVTPAINKWWGGLLDTEVVCGKLDDDAGYWHGMSLISNRMHMIELPNNRDMESLLWELARMPIGVITPAMVYATCIEYQEDGGTDHEPDDWMTNAPEWVLKPKDDDILWHQWYQWGAVAVTTEAVPFDGGLGKHIEALWYDIAQTSSHFGVWYSRNMDLDELRELKPCMRKLKQIIKTHKSWSAPV
jgi:hypothetical protein